MVECPHTHPSPSQAKKPELNWWFYDATDKNSRRIMNTSLALLSQSLKATKQRSLKISDTVL